MGRIDSKGDYRIRSRYIDGTTSGLFIPMPSYFKAREVAMKLARTVGNDHVESYEVYLSGDNKVLFRVSESDIVNKTKIIKPREEICEDIR